MNRHIGKRRASWISKAPRPVAKGDREVGAAHRGDCVWRMNLEIRRDHRPRNDRVNLAAKQAKSRSERALIRRQNVLIEDDGTRLTEFEFAATVEIDCEGRGRLGRHLIIQEEWHRRAYTI
jgi:hypothetical protein